MLDVRNGDYFTMSIQASRDSHLAQIAILAAYSAHGPVGFVEGVVFFWESSEGHEELINAAEVVAEHVDLSIEG